MRARGEEAVLAARPLEENPACTCEIPGLQLRCPRCGSDVSTRACPRCAFHFEEVNGIVRALPPERAEHFAQFIGDYEKVRNAEGRGSESAEFYLNLPFRDVIGRNRRQWEIRAQSFACLMRSVLTPQLPAGARILDLGAGNGWLSFRLARAGYNPVAVDLLTNERDGLAAAEHYRAHLPEFFPRFCAELARLPFASRQFDAAVFNASFHYAEDDVRVLQEALRCVRDGGFVIVCDTPWYSSEASGKAMVRERRANFLRQHGTASASLRSVEYLTDERLRSLEEQASIRWTAYFPQYGLRWAMRPLAARLRRRREPAQFRIYTAHKATI
jgi:SAM-dependent methyltransferase